MNYIMLTTNLSPRIYTMSQPKKIRQIRTIRVRKNIRV